ncbi:Nitrate ABC transporter, nitrate-binding protein [Pseudomonas chlororaphis]|nr:Nitrate ABC transporter, nitrate-binding protein [Pseudomonas chlororaphis]
MAYALHRNLHQHPGQWRRGSKDKGVVTPLALPGARVRRFFMEVFYRRVFMEGATP